MAIEDFYSKHNYTTMIVPHFRNSSSHAVAAASSAIDLLKNTKVLAILGPQKSSQADFVVDIGEEVRVPIISFATSPTLSPKQSTYFIRSAWCSSSQAKAIAAIVKAFGWREVVAVYEDSDYGRGLLPFLTEHLLYTNALVSYQSVISPNANNSQIRLELVKLMSMQVRVFVVHVPPTLASRFFQVAKEAGMMSKGYGWMVADPLTSLLDCVDSDAIEAMQGVIGVKAYVPKSSELKEFTRRWSKRFHEENRDMDRTELNVFGLWAYDSITALAEAVERVGVTSPKFKKPVERGSLTDVEAIGTSNTGPSLVHFIRNYRFKGLSGDFSITNGELEPIAFEVVNVIGRGGNRVGFWTEEYGISKELKPENKGAVYSTNVKTFGGILWPGQTTVVPKGWELPLSGKKLRIAVPMRRGFTEFVKVERHAETNIVEVTGFCIDIFTQVMGSIPYAVPYEFIAVEPVPRGPSAVGNNFSWVNLQDQKIDAVVGDVTITANRSEYVDFSFPYTESGVAAIVPIKGDKRKNAWIFMQPLTTGLWLTIGAFFIFTGFVVWALEHRVNEEFRGPPQQQVGMILWFSFSTLVFAHREKVRSNLTRFVVIVWVFVVLVLTSSYTANLTSMLTVEQLQPSITDINDLIRSHDFVGFQDASFVSDLFSSMNFDRSMFRYYSSVEEYDEALSKGSRNGGVGAIVDELPYIRLFLSKYCHKYTMIGPIYQTSGFGFVFPKGSPLTPDVSRAILKLKEDEAMRRISRKWFGNGEGEGCKTSDGALVTSKSLNLDSFRGLFLIAGLSSLFSLAIFLSIFLYENRHIWSSSASLKQKLSHLATVFCQEKEKVDTLSSTRSRIAAESPAAISIYCDQEEMFSQDEGFSTSIQHE